jgi:hypothetical protein
MGYSCCGVGYNVQGCLDCATYNINSHGDIGAFYNSITNADLPQYTARFYSKSPHESFSDLSYSKVELNYDKSLTNIHDSIKGPPLEAYLPAPVMVSDTASASPSILIRDVELMPKRTIVDEILKAQAEILGKTQRPAILEATEVVQEIRLQRRFRRLRIVHPGIN